MNLHQIFPVLVIIATSFIESTKSLWDANVKQYESSNVQKVPVYYGAYYPDEEYLNSATVLEPKTEDYDKRYSYLDARLNPIGRQELFYQRNPERYPISPIESKLSPEIIDRERNYYPLYSSDEGLRPAMRNWNLLDDPLENEPSQYSLERIPDNRGEEEIFQEQDVARDYRVLRNLAKMEHIFEPRPQIINYIFSAEKNVKKLSKETRDKSLNNLVTSVPLKITNENLTNDDVKKPTDLRQKSQIMSLVISETSEKPHKIRHHHGDRSKRDWFNRNRT